MTVFNLGSINVDYVYRVAHLPEPGETLAATGFERMLGGKGANQSVAAARAGARIVHIGMVGDDSAPREELAGYGVDVSAVGTVSGTTGHANIYVDDEGENLIVIWPGANDKQSLTHVEMALSNAGKGDFLLLQNEASLSLEAAKIARAKGCFVIYSAAPFSADRAEAMLGHIDLLVLNAVEAQQMAAHLGVRGAEIDVPNILITRGAKGATWRGTEVLDQPAFSVDPVDTTGAGDCFIGYVAAGLDEGLSIAEALELGAAASAIQVTRSGTAPAMPARGDVEALITGS